MNDPDQMITWSSRGNGLPDRLWTGNNKGDGERSAADLTVGLANLGFLTAALRRRARVWCLTAVLGLVVGTGLYVKFPPAYHASATVLLAYSPNANPFVQVANEAGHQLSQPGIGAVRDAVDDLLAQRRCARIGSGHVPAHSYPT